MTAYATLWPDLCADIERYEAQGADFAGRRPGLLRKLGILATPALNCVVLYRVSHWLWTRGWIRPARLLAWINCIVHRASISPASVIGPGLYIPHTVGVFFHGRAGARLSLFAHGCVVAGTPLLARRTLHEDCPSLGDGVAVGAYAIVVGASVLGDEARIGPHALVARDVPVRCSVVSRRNRPRVLRPEPAVVAAGLA